MERALGFGSYSPLASEIRHSVSFKQLVQDYTFGLGGRDIGPEEIEKVFKQLLKGRISDNVKYVGLRK